jgi:hypothetical protein
LIASVGLMAEKSVEPAFRHQLLLLCNGPGLLLAAILFSLLGGLSTAHGGRDPQSAPFRLVNRYLTERSVSRLPGIVSGKVAPMPKLFRNCPC